MKQLQLNHVALHVADVERSSQFYTQALQLEPLSRPAFDFPGAWFRLGVDQELHLIGGRTAEVQSHHRGNHFALRVDRLVEWENHLQELGVTMKPRKQRPDGFWQIFVCDPDGHFVELCADEP
jgi:catechol 2,3-dioxygenase-like lactoylglutathione lyase family enzyme